MFRAILSYNYDSTIIIRLLLYYNDVVDAHATAAKLVSEVF